MREALQQQFCSLVVNTENDSQSTPSVVRDPVAEADTERRGKVLYAIERFPGASGATLRAALRGTRQVDVDSTVLSLIVGDFVRDDRKGNAHAYHLSARGHGELEALRARDQADIANTAVALAHIQQKGTIANDGPNGVPIRPNRGTEDSSQPVPTTSEHKGRLQDDLGTTSAKYSSRSSRPHKGRDRTRSPDPKRKKRVHH